MHKNFLEIGEVVTTHGLLGEVRVYPWCDSPDFITQFSQLYLNNGDIELEVEKARVHKNVVVLKFVGYNTIEEATKLKKKIIYIDRDDVELDEDTFFIQDLIGLSVIDIDKDIVYGKISKITQTGANDVYHIAKNGKEVLVPAIPDVVIDINLDKGEIKIRPLNGLFEPEELHGGENDAV